MSTKSGSSSRLLVVMATATAMILTFAISAWAAHAHVEISIPLSTNFGAPEGSVTELATEPVPEGFADHMCEVTAHTQNQKSVHPGNNILVASGTSQVVLEDVEAEPGQVIDANGMLELGEVITVSLVMGPTEGFSAGIEVVVECFEEETTTTAQVQPTSESTPSTTPEVEPDQATTTPPTDEVKGTEVLPFTGSDDAGLGLLAVALLAGGTLLVVGTRRREE